MLLAFGVCMGEDAGRELLGWGRGGERGGLSPVDSGIASSRMKAAPAKAIEQSSAILIFQSRLQITICTCPCTYSWFVCLQPYTTYMQALWGALVRQTECHLGQRMP